MAGIEETFGALLVGVLIGAIFFGVTNLQVYIYFQTYVQDRIWTRATVCYLWVIDALCVAFSFHMMYYYLVICYFDPSGLDTIIWSFKAQAILTTVTVSSVQALYATRIWALVKSSPNQHVHIRYVLPIVVTVLVLAGSAATIVCSWELTSTASPNAVLSREWTTDYPLSVWTGADAVIAVSLCYLLRGMRTGHYNTETVISKLTLYAITTGASTTLFSLSAIIVAGTSPNTFVMGVFKLLMAKLYINSFVAMLNARQTLRQEAVAANQGIEISLPSTQDSSFSRRKSTAPSNGHTNERMGALRVDLSGADGLASSSAGRYSNVSHQLHGRGDVVDPGTLSYIERA